MNLVDYHGRVFPGMQYLKNLSQKKTQNIMLLLSHVKQIWLNTVFGTNHILQGCSSINNNVWCRFIFSD